MREFGVKVCLFLFLTALLSGRTNELGTLTGGITGTILLWPLYRKVLPAPTLKPRRKPLVEAEEPETAAE